MVMRGSGEVGATGRVAGPGPLPGVVPPAGAPAAAGAPGAVVVGGTGEPAGATGGGGAATWPSGTMRNTISTPLFPVPEVSFSSDCSRRKSIASRMVASRNSIRGIMMVFSLLVICAVPPRPFCDPIPTGSPAWPYLRTGCSQPFSTCQSWRDRVSLYASSPYLYLVLLIFSWPLRAAVLYGSSAST